MSRRFLHIALALLVLAQPVTSVAASLSMLGASLASAAESTHDMGDMQMSGMDMTGCHDDVPAAPDCCADMDGVSCDMDCGTVSPAFNQAHSPLGVEGHGAFEGRQVYAAPSHSPNTFLKPPRTS